MVLFAFLLGLVLVAGATAFCVLRGFQLWRGAKKTGGVVSAEMELFEERSRLTEQLLAEAERGSADLQAQLAQLQRSRAHLQVLLGALERAKKRTRWLQTFLPVR